MITFEPSNETFFDKQVEIRIVDDGTNEAEEDFVVIVEFEHAINPSAVDLSVQNASVIRIQDDDRKLLLVNVSGRHHLRHY